MHGQTPSYYTIGEKELANADVYSILETPDRVLYAGTNQGLFVYRNGKFRLVRDNVPGSAGEFFSLKCDANGDVFCCDLQGGIYRVENEELKLYAALPDSLISPFVDFQFDGNNDLIVGGIGCYRWKAGRWTRLVYSRSSSVAMAKSPNGDVLYSNSYELCRIKPDGEVIITTLQKPERFQRDFVVGYIGTLNGEEMYSWRDSKGTKWSCQLNDHEIWGKDEKNRVSYLMNFEVEGYNGIWMVSGYFGVDYLRFDGEQLHLEDHIFPDQFISYHQKGLDGVHYFGTFKKGIMVVTNFDSKRYEEKDEKSIINSLSVTQENEVFQVNLDAAVQGVGDDRKIIYSCPGHLDEVFALEGKARNLLNIKAITSDRVLLRDNVVLSSIKDIKEMPSGALLAATNRSICLLNKEVANDFDRFNWRESLPYGGVCVLEDFYGRCRTIEFDTNDRVLYVGKYVGVLAVFDSTHREELLFEGEDIIPNSMEFGEGRLWIGSNGDGVLIFQNSQLVGRLSKENGLNGNIVRKIELNDGKLFILHENGFQIYDVATKNITTLGTSEGLDAEFISDFSVSKDRIWFVVNNGLEDFPLSEAYEREPVWNIVIDSILFGNQHLMDEQRSFSHLTNELRLYFNYSSVQFQSGMFLQYRISDLESTWNEVHVSEGNILYKTIPSGDHTLELRLRYRNQFGYVHPIVFSKNHPFWERWWFYLLLIVVVLLVSVFVYRRRLKTLSKKSKEALDKQRIQTNLLESQMRALRSQMNPHFIFNSLNSIQDLILKEDTEGSYDYIALFAKLVRNTLNYSDRDFIDIDDELNFLKTYLSLEKLRFKDEFEYHVDYDGPDEILVPSLLIQPFIENALIHGLMHKEGQKKLEVLFRMDEKVLTCEVKDNGVGRKHAENIRKRQGSHESFALRAISQRLRILNEREGGCGGYEIQDLEESGEALGTLVTITIPFKSDLED